MWSGAGSRPAAASLGLTVGVFGPDARDHAEELLPPLKRLMMRTPARLVAVKPLQLDEGLAMHLNEREVRVRVAKEELLLVVFNVKFQRKVQVLRHGPSQLDLPVVSAPTRL